MENPQEFIERTESAMKHLFSGIREYMTILKKSPVVGFSVSFASEQAYQRALEEWNRQNESDIRRSLEAQQQFSAERYAFGVLCGSVLQVASTAIRMYSSNEKVDSAIARVAQAGNVAAQFSIGRKVRGIPIGLIIYAGRNQYNHMDEGRLREPNATIFNKIAVDHMYGSNIIDPAFDLDNELVRNYSANITGLLDWRDYSSYAKDMRMLLNLE